MVKREIDVSTSIRFSQAQNCLLTIDLCLISEKVASVVGFILWPRKCLIGEGRIWHPASLPSSGGAGSPGALTGV